jgi:transcriptional regulator with XRE-family HTH domain
MFICVKHKSQPNDTLVANLRALIARTKISKEELAKRSGVSERMVAYILAKDRTPTIETTAQLAQAFGLHSWELLLPDLATNLEAAGKLDRLIKNYSASSDKGREYIDRVAEKEAKYRS